MSAGSATEVVTEKLEEQVSTDAADKEVVGTDAPAEIQPEPESAEPEPDKEPEPEVWVNDDVKELADSFGVSEDQLKRYGSADDFYRAIANADRGLASKAVPTDRSSEKAKEEKAPSFDPQKLIDGEYDEELQLLGKDYKSFKDRVEAALGEVEAFKQQRMEEARLRHLEDFHDIVDTLDESLFGRSVVVDSESSKELHVELDAVRAANRGRLGDAMDTIAWGIVQQAQAAGQKPQLPPMKALVKRAMNMEFGEEIRRAERDKRQADISRQSKRRRAAATGKRTVPLDKDTSPTSTTEQRVQSVLNHPSMLQKLKELDEDRGG